MSLAECSTQTCSRWSFGRRTVDVYAKEHQEAMPHTIKTLVRLMLQTIFLEGLFHAVRSQVTS